MKTLTITLLPCRGSAISIGSVVFTLPLKHEPSVAEQRSLLKAAQAQMDAAHTHPLVDLTVIPVSRFGEAELRYIDTNPASARASAGPRRCAEWSVFPE